MKRASFMIGLIALLVVVILALQKVPTAQEDALTQSWPTLPPIVHEDAPSDWKTYTVPQCHVSFEYPPDLVAHDPFAVGYPGPIPSGTYFAAVQTQADIDAQKTMEGEAPPFLYLGLDCWENMEAFNQHHSIDGEPGNYTSLLGYLTSADFSPDEYSKTTFNGLRAYEVAESWDNSSLGLYFEREDTLYHLNLSGVYHEGANTNREDLLPVQRQILSSFTFAD